MGLSTRVAWIVVVGAASALVFACADEGMSGPGVLPSQDASVEASDPDASDPDASNPDASDPDTGAPDATVNDAGSPDAMGNDAASQDASAPDASGKDAASQDASVPDASCTVNQSGGNDGTPSIVTSVYYVGGGGYACAQYVCDDGTWFDASNLNGPNVSSKPKYLGTLSPSDLAALRAAIKSIRTADAGATVQSGVCIGKTKFGSTTVYDPTPGVSVDSMSCGNSVYTLSTSNDPNAATVRKYACSF